MSEDPTPVDSTPNGDAPEKPTPSVPTPVHGLVTPAPPEDRLAAVVIRCGALRQRMSARTPIADLRPGDLVAVRTTEATEAAVVLDSSGGSTDESRGPVGRVVRRLTDRDAELLSEQEESLEREIRTFAANVAKEQKLPVRVEDVEIPLGGETVRVYYMARESFDLGPWVRALASRFRRHFTLRKISPREASRLTGDVGFCGHELCCLAFVRDQKPVSMRMARLQKITLDPASLAGFCGPIRCCIRHEFEFYQECDKALPKNGCRVCTKEGACGVVRRRNLLKQSVLLLTQDESLVEVGLDEIDTVQPPSPDGGRRGMERDGSADPRSSDRFTPYPRRDSSRNPKESGEIRTEGEDRVPEHDALDGDMEQEPQASGDGQAPVAGPMTTDFREGTPPRDGIGPHRNRRRRRRRRNRGFGNSGASQLPPSPVDPPRVP